MIGFIGTSVTISVNYNQYSAMADLRVQSTVAHALGFSVSTSRLLATDLNIETSTSNHYEVFLPFLVQSPGASELNSTAGPIVSTTNFPRLSPTTTELIPIPVFSYILSARTTNRKHSPSIVAWFLERVY
jgi:hypothetical protein